MKSILQKTMAIVAAAIVSIPAMAVVNDIKLKNATPKTGELDAEIRDLSSITLTFTADVNVRDNTLATLDTPGGEKLTAPMQRNRYLKNTVIVDFPDLIMYNGDYTLTIKKWSVGDEAWLEDYEQGHSNEEIKLKWTVVNALEAGLDYSLEPLSILPANNSVFTYPASPLRTVRITMPAGTLMDTEKQVHLEYVEARYGINLIFEAEDNGNSVVYTAEVSPSPSLNGDYTMYIPAAMFGDSDFMAGNGGKTNPPISYVYPTNPSDPNATGDEETVDWSLAPSEQTITSDGNVYTLTWTWPQGLTTETAKLKDWRILDNRGYRVPDVVFTLLDEANPATGIRFNAALKQDEDYMVIVPQGMFVNATYVSTDGLQGKANAQLAFRFKSSDINSGAEAIAAAPEHVRSSVYTSQGILLHEDASPAQIQALGPGLYIIAGRKVIIR